MSTPELDPHLTGGVSATGKPIAVWSGRSLGRIRRPSASIEWLANAVDEARGSQADRQSASIPYVTHWTIVAVLEYLWKTEARLHAAEKATVALNSALTGPLAE